MSRPAPRPRRRLFDRTMRGAAMLAALLHFALVLIPCAAIGGGAIHGPAVEQHAGADFQHDESLCAICTAHHSAITLGERIVPWLGDTDREPFAASPAPAVSLGPTLRPSSRAPPGTA